MTEAVEALDEYVVTRSLDHDKLWKRIPTKSTQQQQPKKWQNQQSSQPKLWQTAESATQPASLSQQTLLLHKNYQHEPQHSEENS